MLALFVLHKELDYIQPTLPSPFISVHQILKLVAKFAAFEIVHF